jgi:hypothetical protein
MYDGRFVAVETEVDDWAVVNANWRRAMAARALRVNRPAI